MTQQEAIHKHRRAVLLLLLTCAFCINAKAQLWNKTYIEDRGVMLFSSVLFDDSVYVVTGVVNDTGNIHATKSIIGNINLGRDVTKYRSFVDTSRNDYYGIFKNNLIKTSSRKLAFSGEGYTSLAYLVFGIADSNLDTISIFRYTLPNTSLYHGNCLIEKENGFYIAGIRTDSTHNYDSRVFIAKIDNEGNRIWQKEFNSPSYYEEAKSLISLQNDNLMLGAMRRDLNQTLEHANTWLIEVDTGGNVVRQWFDPNDSTYAAEGLLQTQDGGFIYGAQKKCIQYNPDVKYKASIVRLDSNFNKQWVLVLGECGDYTSITDIEPLNSGDFILCGSKRYEGVDTNNVGGWVMKLSSAGEVLWSRTYTGLPVTQTINLLTDIDIMPDGGLIAVGQCQNLQQTPPQVGWFLKLDSNGCEIENCIVGINEVTDKVQLNVYPNPFINQITIVLNEAGHQQVSISISNLIGQTIYTNTETNIGSTYTKNIDLGHVPNGIYFIEVIADGEKVVRQLVKE